MKYFVIFSETLLVLCLAVFIKIDKGSSFNVDFSLMSRDFTTSIKGFTIFIVEWAHIGEMLGVSGV